MSKAILVVDMPESCNECPLCYDCYSCIVTGTNLFDNNLDPANDKPKDCPLKELPEKKKYHYETFNGEVKGWNACLDEILN